MEPKVETSMKKSLFICLLTVAALMVSTIGTAKVYRWVDEDGEVHYSETLPPNFEDKGHDVLNERGIVTDEDQLLTPPPPEEKPDDEQLKELPRDSSGMRRPTQLYSDAELQRRMDNFLLLRYDSEQEIIDAMDVEIKQLNYDRRLLEGSRNSMNNAYRGQIRVAANRQRTGKEVAEDSIRQIDDLQAKLAENASSLNGLEQREIEIRSEFQKQLDRYRYLIETWEEESAG